MSKHASIDGNTGEIYDVTNTSKSTNTKDLNVNELEQIIADHNKAMRTDMASEITGGNRSKAITDVITVKAILQWVAKDRQQLIQRIREEMPKTIIAEMPNATTVAYNHAIRDVREILETMEKEVGGSDE